MMIDDPLYDRKYDKKFFSDELKLKANDPSIASATEVILKENFGHYNEDEIREYMQKVYKAWHFYTDNFKRWVDVL